MPQIPFHRRTLIVLLALALGTGGWLWWQAGSRIEPGSVTWTAVASPNATSAVESAFSDYSVFAGSVSPGAPEVATGNADAPKLFSFVDTAEATRLNAALPAPSAEVHYVRVNSGLAAGKQSPFWNAPGGGRVSIPLPEGGALVVAIEGSELLGPARFISKGEIEGHSGSQVLFAWNEGFLHASLEVPGRGVFALRTATSELAQFYQLDPTRIPPCGGPRQPQPVARVRSAAATSKTTALDGPELDAPPIAAAENPQRAEVHVMMLYTPAVLPTLSGQARAAAIQSAFDLAVEKVNRAFAASLISARVKLVRIAETAYDESASRPSQVQDDALSALYQENDGRMDEIHALRDSSGADIVCLALNRPDAASSGLSFLLNTSDDPANQRFAFSVVQYSNVAGTNVVPHEFGHVLGCAHDRENAMSGAGAFSFSYGYRFFGADGRQYHDIMSYPPGLELGYFSNPDVIVPAPVNAAIGIPAGRPGESNSALTIERMAFASASFRLQTQAAASAGSLINVATRAFVGTGDDVMIGGFVVEGLQPKRMLIRAAGPALRNFGVADALADPMLHVYRAGAVVAENDNWSQPLGAGSPAAPAEITHAASRASAFAFFDGSADAAVLVSLPPGAYSAVLEGVDGATGQGLIEAYAVERDAARIINLATRAHAGREGRELLGGFVVDGAAGATKRILIRVLGPTLARSPFNMSGVLEDPEMELRNAVGDLLIRNDDWSSGAVDGPSEENDFHPLVELYGERQVFATGLAPLNRREPCVLVDLPPGGYTVTVRPFELRSANPQLDQSAVPGVGIIEVYEIRQ